MKHKNKDDIIQVTSKRGKPVSDKAGWVKLEKGKYKTCDRVSIEILNEKFERIA